MTQTNTTATHGQGIGVLGVQPIATQMTEAEAIAADLHNDIDKAGKAHQAQERNAMRLQIRHQSRDWL